MSNNKKTIVWILSLLAALLLTGCNAAENIEPAAETVTPTQTPESTPEPIPEPVMAKLSLADQAEHPALMTISEDGYFRSARGITRANACSLLYEVLDGCPAGGVVLADIDRGNENYKAVIGLCKAGVLPLQAGDSFRPDDWITRQELAEMIQNLSLCFEGEDSARIGDLAADVAAGVTANPGVSNAQTAAVSRAEFAVVLERLTGREPDEAALLTGGYLPADIHSDSYAWAYIADAVNEGEIQPAQPGVYRADGGLYAVDETGEFRVDIDYGVWTFGLDGRYTTGSEELDGYLAQVLQKINADELTDEEALEAAFLYIKYNYEYVVQPEDMETLAMGVTGWEYGRALRFFQNGGGTCYGYAAAFGLLARALGQNAYIVSAEVNQYYAPHGFVVIPADGVDWIYDVELESTRQERHGDLDLFRIKNHVVYDYWYTPDW